MSAFRPYRFLIFGRCHKNHAIHSLLMHFLDHSLLCKEICIHENFSKLRHDVICKNKPIYYYPDTEPPKWLNQNKIQNILQEKDSGTTLYDIAESLSGNENGMKKESERESERESEKKSERESEKKSGKESKRESRSGNVKKREDQREQQLQGEKVMTQHYEQMKQTQTNLVTLFIWDRHNSEEFQSFLNICKQLSATHVNILCLHNYSKVEENFQNYSFSRVSIFKPFYIICDNEKNKNLTRKIIDTLYDVAGNFLPLKYKSVHLSDLTRAIILNSELCQQTSENYVEVLSFFEVMEILGKV